jgi:hypothetical protein
MQDIKPINLTNEQFLRLYLLLKKREERLNNALYSLLVQMEKELYKEYTIKELELLKQEYEE